MCYFSHKELNMIVTTDTVSLVHSVYVMALKVRCWSGLSYLTVKRATIVSMVGTILPSSIMLYKYQSKPTDRRLQNFS